MNRTRPKSDGSLVISLLRNLGILGALLLWPVASRAGITVLVQEPYSSFGAINPTGHAALYFSGVCAETPIRLRNCGPGESGVVISRYSRISGYDWVAIPVIPYLYAVERIEDVPAEASASTVARLREQYRRDHLRDVVPDGTDGQTPGGAWVELVGAAYNRKIYGFSMESSETQDDQFIQMLNSRKNRSHFNLFLNNCADFVRHVLNTYYPGVIKRNLVGDAGITTPKQIAKCVVKYTRSHPELHLTAFYVAQIPGSRRPSHKIDGVCEGFVKSKKYIVPLTVFHPWAAGMVILAYAVGGHFNIAHIAETEYTPAELQSLLSVAGSGLSDVSSSGSDSIGSGATDEQEQ